jgi:hypothetical protein
VKAQRGGEIAVIFFNLGPAWGVVVKALNRQLYSLERDPVPIL